jgi:hypothetical protein
MRVAETHAARLGGGERRLSPLRNQTGFQFGDPGHQRKEELPKRAVRQLREIAEHNSGFTNAFRYRQQKRRIPGESIKLRDDKPSLMLPARGEGS